MFFSVGVFLKRGALPRLMAHALLLVKGFKLCVFIWFPSSLCFLSRSQWPAVCFFLLQLDQIQLAETISAKILQSSLGQEFMDKDHVCVYVRVCLYEKKEN